LTDLFSSFISGFATGQIFQTHFALIFSACQHSEDMKAMSKHNTLSRHFDQLIIKLRVAFKEPKCNMLKATGLLSCLQMKIISSEM